MQLVTMYSNDVVLSCYENFVESNFNNFNLDTINCGTRGDKPNMFYDGL